MRLVQIAISWTPIPNYFPCTGSSCTQWDAYIFLYMNEEKGLETPLNMVLQNSLDRNFLLLLALDKVKVLDVSLLFLFVEISTCERKNSWDAWNKARKLVTFVYQCISVCYWVYVLLNMGKMLKCIDVWISRHMSWYCLGFLNYVRPIQFTWFWFWLHFWQLENS